MRCYFYAHKPGPPETTGDGVVSFCLPELNITFRARYRGTAASCEYAALLALLEFVEINPKLFEGRTLEVFGDSFTVVNQVNERLFCRKDLEPFRNKAVGFRKKVPYILNYVPTRENPAQGQIAPE
jgi:ribonuclease HI